MCRCLTHSRRPKCGRHCLISLLLIPYSRSTHPSPSSTDSRGFGRSTPVSPSLTRKIHRRVTFFLDSSLNHNNNSNRSATVTNNSEPPPFRRATAATTTIFVLLVFSRIHAACPLPLLLLRHATPPLASFSHTPPSRTVFPLDLSLNLYFTLSHFPTLSPIPHIHKHQQLNNSKQPSRRSPPYGQPSLSHIISLSCFFVSFFSLFSPRLSNPPRSSIAFF